MRHAAQETPFAQCLSSFASHSVDSRLARAVLYSLGQLEYQALFEVVQQSSKVAHYGTHWVSLPENLSHQELLCNPATLYYY